VFYSLQVARENFYSQMFCNCRGEPGDWQFEFSVISIGHLSMQVSEKNRLRELEIIAGFLNYMLVSCRFGERKLQQQVEETNE